ncbi:MAG: hypothetical protein ACYDEX_23780, partial [Mobilitalea sp.]
MHKISEVTRTDIFDILTNGFVDIEMVDKPHPDYFYYQEIVETELKMNCSGRLDEATFLNRLFKLKEL